MSAIGEKSRDRLFPAFTLATCLLLAFFVLVQLTPSVGDPFIFLGGGFLVGLLVHLVLAAIFVDAVRRRLPMAAAIVPIIFYGGYALLCVNESRTISDVLAKMKAQNDRAAYAFDPVKQNLVAKDAIRIVAEYDIPVVYELNTSHDLPDGYISYRRLSNDQCVAAMEAWQNLPASLRPKIGVIWGSGLPVFGRLQPIPKDTGCFLRLPQNPRLETLSVVDNQTPTDNHGNTTSGGSAFIFKDLEFRIGATKEAVVRKAYIGPLPVFPWFYLACSLHKSDYWDSGCDFRVLRFYSENPDGSKRARVGLASDPIVGRVLGLRRLTNKERHAPVPADEFRGLLSEIVSYPTRMNEATSARDADLFAAFVAFLDGGVSPREMEYVEDTKPRTVVPAVPYTLGDSIERNPARLEPLREKLVEKLVGTRYDATPMNES